MSLFDTIDATWPTAAFTHCGAVTLRDGQGGGNTDVCQGRGFGEDQADGRCESQGYG